MTNKNKGEARRINFDAKTKIALVISLAKIWQKEFRILSFNTLFNVIMNMNNVEFLKYCKLYGIIGNQFSHTDKEKIDQVAEEDSDDDI